MGAGVPISGIIGHDCFMAGVFDIDLSNSTVHLFDPKTFKLNDSQGTWTAVKLVGRRPAVEGRIERSEPGMLLLDTGSNEGLLVHSPTVKKLNLLDGRDDRKRQSGRGRRRVQIRPHGNAQKRDGRRLRDHRRPRVVRRATEGLTASDEVLATAGLKFLRNFRMIVNQSTNSIAFSRAKVPTTSPTTGPAK